MPDRRSLAVVFVAALLCRAALWAFALPDSSRYFSPPDSAEYLTIARNLAAGHGFSGDASPPYQPDVRRTPIYPSLLAAVLLTPFGGERLAALVGVLAGSAAVALTFWIAWRLFGARAATAGALLLAVDLSSASYSPLILTETVFTALMMAGVIALMRRPPAQHVDVTGGSLLGVAALCRPAGILLGLVSWPVCAWRGAGWRAAARGYLRVNVAFAVVALLWVGRNVAVADTMTFSSIASVNIYFHRAVFVEARILGKSPDAVRATWEREFEALSAQWSDAAKMKWMAERGRSIILAHPLVYMQVTIDGFLLMMAPETAVPSQLLGLATTSAAHRAVGAAASIQLWLVYLAAALAVVASVRDPERRRAMFIPLSFIAYFVLVSGPEAYQRFRVPIMPFMTMLSGVGIEQLAALVPRQRFLTRANSRSYLPSTTSQR